MSKIKYGISVKINGIFPDQQGRVRIGEITGWNGNGIPCRKYTWIEPKLPQLRGTTFEAFDDQIEKAIKRGKT
jgi:hypothetical protein